MTTQHALAPAHAAMPKGPEGGGGGGSSDGDGGGGVDEDPTTIHITHNWRSPSMALQPRVCWDPVHQITEKGSAFRSFSWWVGLGRVNVFGGWVAKAGGL